MMAHGINLLADHEMAMARAVPQAMPGWDTCLGARPNTGGHT